MICSFKPGTGDGRPVSSDVIISVASGTMRMLQTFDTNGTVRDALGLASNTYTLPFSIAYCIFIRPFTCISSAIFLVYSWIVTTFSSEICTDGIMQAESPEWIPASSICSITAGTNACVPSLMASASHSSAWFRKRSIKIGRSGVTPTAAFIYSAILSSSYTTSIPRPPSTYDGRTITGYPILFAIEMAPSTDVAIPDSGMGISNFSIISRNRSRSSARSMTDGDVPSIFTPFFSSSDARLSGVCPPNCAITPSGFSFS